MSLITRCPACETMFKVVPDQLRISDGWVRCGQCGEIFDASLHLLEDSNADDIPPARSDAPAATAQRAPAPEVQFEVVAADAAAASGPLDDSVAPRGEVQAGTAPAQSARTGEPVWIDLAVADPEPPDEVPEPPPNEHTPAPSDFPATQADADDDAPKPSFMRDIGKTSVWRRPMVRVVLAVLALLLLAILAAQVLRHERNRVAAIEPAAKPLLLALCRWSLCDISPIRQIDSVVIDSSSFSRDRGDNYRLGFSLKNNAGIDIAMPAIELSLTDSQDQPLFRRVIRPAEFGAGSALLPAGSDWGNTLTLSVKPTTAVDRIAGYRLLAFYP